ARGAFPFPLPRSTELGGKMKATADVSEEGRTKLVAKRLGDGFGRDNDDDVAAAHGTHRRLQLGSPLFQRLLRFILRGVPGNGAVIALALGTVIVKEAQALQPQGAAFTLHAARLFLVEILRRELPVAFRAQTHHGVSSLCSLESP